MRSARNDLRSQPAYSLAEAARHLKVAGATLRSWVVARPYPRADGVGHFRPLIHPPTHQPPVLSFWNLIEAHVLRSLRTDHGVSIKALREAVGYAEKSLHIERLLLSKESRTEAGQVFLERANSVIFVFFTDRDLGTRFPDIPAVGGLSVERHKDPFAPDCSVEERLAAIEERAWIAVTHDRRIPPAWESLARSEGWRSGIRVSGNVKAAMESAR